MAPPNLYELPAQPGLMSPSRDAPVHTVSLRALLWSIAAALAAVELLVELTLP